MLDKKKDFFTKKRVIGMVHLLPLPMSPDFGGDIEKIKERAISDAKSLVNGGIDALIIENFGDVPYDTEIPLPAYSVMLSIAKDIKNIVSVPIGINIQFNCYEEEFSMAYAINADFIRVETFAESRIGSFGSSNSCAPKLMRLKKEYQNNTMIFADINVKHSYASYKASIYDCAYDAIESKADALIITGKLTGVNPSLEDVKELKEHIENIPLIVGSGVNETNINDFFQYVDAVIVGSSLKKDGIVDNEVDEERVKNLIKSIK